MMEENNDIFLAGGSALVYLAEPMHKKYSTTFVWGHPFGTFTYRIHWNINKKILYKKINGKIGWNKHLGEQY